MIVNAKEMLEKAKKGHYAVPHFNINNLEWTRFILETCEEEQSPVIIGVSEGAARYMGGFEVVANMVKNLHNSLKITVPVAIHLDHGSSVENASLAMQAGFTSIMIDGSKYDLETNIAMTKEVVALAHQQGISVEAEVGHIGGEEDGNESSIAYAEVDDCLKFVSETKIDFFAPALGSVHGIYHGEPKLDFERMATISKLTNLPLVLHGGSGIPDSMIKKAISSGICKLNINTELQQVWAYAVKEFLKQNDVYDPRKIIKSGEAAMKQAIKEKIYLLGSDKRQ